MSGRGNGSSLASLHTRVAKLERLQQRQLRASLRTVIAGSTSQSTSRSKNQGVSEPPLTYCPRDPDSRQSFQHTYGPLVLSIRNQFLEVIPLLAIAARWRCVPISPWQNLGVPPGFDVSPVKAPVAVMKDWEATPEEIDWLAATTLDERIAHARREPGDAEAVNHDSWLKAVASMCVVGDISGELIRELAWDPYGDKWEIADHVLKRADQLTMLPASVDGMFHMGRTFQSRVEVGDIPTTADGRVTVNDVWVAFHLYLGHSLAANWSVHVRTRHKWTSERLGTEDTAKN